MIATALIFQNSLSLVVNNKSIPSCGNRNQTGYRLNQSLHKTRYSSSGGKHRAYLMFQLAICKLTRDDKAHWAYQISHLAAPWGSSVVAPRVHQQGLLTNHSPGFLLATPPLEHPSRGLCIIYRLRLNHQYLRNWSRCLVMNKSKG